MLIVGAVWIYNAMGGSEAKPQSTNDVFLGEKKQMVFPWILFGSGFVTLLNAYWGTTRDPHNPDNANAKKRAEEALIRSRRLDDTPGVTSKDTYFMLFGIAWIGIGYLLFGSDGFMHKLRLWPGLLLCGVGFFSKLERLEGP